MDNPLIPTPLDVVMLTISCVAMLALAVGAVTLLWMLVVPRRRRQVALLLSGRRRSQSGS
ncbi:hypothetical protein GCM10027406_34070 [Leifsonia lichenia]